MAQRGLGYLAVLAVIGALGACQATPLMPTSKVGFRLIIDNGVATLTGSVRAPAGVVTGAGSLYKISSELSAASKLALAEVPVDHAKVDLVDNHGSVLPAATSVETDSQGRFALRGARIGEAAFLRTTFQGHDGKPHYEYTFVRPASGAECVKVSLATTLVAEAIASKQNLYPVYDPAKLDTIYTQVAANLPATLANLAPTTNFAAPDAAASGAAASVAAVIDPALIQQALNDATIDAAPTGAVGAAAHPTFSTFFDQILAPVQQQLDKATDTFLQVTFTIQSFGSNVWVPSDLQAAQHLVIGPADVLCQAPDDTYASVTFWLNNQKVGAGKATGLLWATRVDSAALADGPYVLTAIAQPKDATAQSVQTKAFLYVLNKQATTFGSCTL
jgi:hypothetical protein